MFKRTLILAAMLTPVMALAASPDNNQQSNQFAPAFGQSQGDMPAWKFSLGVLGMYLPRYQGSNKYRLFAVPNIEIKYKNRFFLSAYQGIGYNMVKTKHWTAGGSISIDYVNGRKRSKEFAGLNNIDNLFAANVFVKYQQFPFNLSANLSHGLGAWDLGSQLRLAATAELPINKKIFIMAGPSIVLADSHYMETYYGINAQQSADTGLSRYKTHAGITKIGLGGSIFYKIAPQWTLGAYENITRYVNSTEKSPLIKKKVDYFTAVGVTYTFTKA